MDFELQAIRPSSRRSRPLAWLAATSGIALVLLALTSTHVTSAANDKAPVVTAQVSTAVSDGITTSSISPSISPMRQAAANVDRHEATPIPQSERHILILLIFACFTVMAAGGFALWRRGWQEVLRKQDGLDT